ncbi:YbaB/EbfC family nucleoid-associated protein [Sodalis-like secondary symbiont of Drepanosiphum platanoidis]|uniref:YbaB/EbfC family nucleoid-associated protein n=1 Tax=Sodalis-like secondary symbiont of Drepanosiphum platanoidis TaxID=2994493 RepID=UPI0034642174
MFNKEDINNFIKQTKIAQEKINIIQKEINKLKIIGESGAGLIKVTINGSYNCIKVNINKNALCDNKNILEDLIASAFNDAINKMIKIKKNKISLLSGNEELLANLKLLF